MICFTICSRNFLAQAYVLYRSLTLHHPETVFYVALCDEVGDLDTPSFPFRIITTHELGIRSFRQMQERYNITELNTALKPFVFNLLHLETPGEPILYFDPDILITSRLEELKAAIDEGADCVLIPHMLEPCEWAEMNEMRLLQYGAYNLGFLMLRGVPEVERINRWWARRLETHCIIDLQRGLFVDQKWADLFPSFIEKTYILRHPGYNVAYWNLATRLVRQEADGSWRVNGQPLRFIHFSGSVLSGDPIFSRHSTEFVRGGLRDLDRLFDQYLDQVRIAGHLHYREAYPYTFNWNGASGYNEHTPQQGGRFGFSTPRYSGSVLDPVRPHLPLLTARTLTEFAEKKAHLEPIIKKRRKIEEDLVPPAQDVFSVRGYCIVCGCDRELLVSSMYSPGRYLDGRVIPNWREHLACNGCGFVNRVRATLHVLFQEVHPRSSDRIYLTEQATPLFRWFSDHFEHITGSEYMGDGLQGGLTVNGYRHEDIQALSFDDGTFDIIVSLEVLEHVPFPDRAFRELRRVLKEGGTLLITVPFRDDRDLDEVRAELMPDGTIKHFMEPEYHGNPVNPEGGALCFRYYGWDIVRQLREAGFRDAAAHFYWSRRLGYLGPTNSIVIARA